MRRTVVRVAMVATMSAALGIGGAANAWANPDARLAARLDAATAGEVQRLVDAARADGLPTEPLVSKALEGEAKGAPPERIVAAVRAQSAALGEARTALGASSSEAEMVAGAGALLSGVPADSLARLRGTRPGKPLVVPLVVLADLMARKVPGDAAVTAVIAVTRAGARDADLLRLRERVERDIARGMTPANAALTRARRWAPGLRPGDDPRRAPVGKSGASQRIETIATPTHETSMRVVSAEGSVAGGASLAGGAQKYGSRADGALRVGLSPRLTLEARTALLALDRVDPAERRLMRSGARVRAGGELCGAWLGAALERSLAENEGPGSLQVGLGAWANPGDLELALSIEQTNEHARIATALPGDRSPNPAVDTTRAALAGSMVGYEERLVRSTSAFLSARWEHGRIGVGSVAGVTVNQYISPRRWMQTSFDVMVKPRLALYATVGSSAPRWLALEPGIERSASLGLRLRSEITPVGAEAFDRRPEAPEFSIRHLGEDWYVIEVRIRAAGPVEVMGDFSGWEPRPLRRLTGSRWALAVRMPPGVHQVQVRVDGGMWSVPGDLPSASDGFSGDVGVFVAR